MGCVPTAGEKAAHDRDFAIRMKPEDGGPSPWEAGKSLGNLKLGAFMILLRRIGVGMILLAGLALMSHVASSFAQQPQPKKDDAGGKKAYVKPKWNEKHIAFEMRAKPWAAVFEWFSDQSGMPFSSQYPAPTGTFNFINPKDPKTGEPKKYTLTEIYDTVNEFLQAQHKFTLLRLDSTLTMVPADEELKGSWFRRVTLEELKECAKTEIVEVVVKLVGQNAEEIAGDVKRAMGDFAKVTPLPNSNQLIIRADVKSLRRGLPGIIPNTFTKTGEVTTTPSIADENNAHTLTHKCKYVRANAAEAVITKSLGTAQVLDFVKAARCRSAGRADGATGGAAGLRAAVPARAGPASRRRRVVKPHTVTSDEASNTVFVTGPTDKIDIAKTILKLDLDGPFPRRQGHSRRPAGLQVSRSPRRQCRDARQDHLGNLQEHEPGARVGDAAQQAPGLRRSANAIRDPRLAEHRSACPAEDRCDLPEPARSGQVH